jgi:hypothetical protein
MLRLRTALGLVLVASAAACGSAPTATEAPRTPPPANDGPSLDGGGTAMAGGGAVQVDTTRRS